jgi:hypothetical protein
VRDAIDARMALDTAQQGLELHDGVAGDEILHAFRRVERLRDTDLAGIRRRLHARGGVRGLAEMVEVVVERRRDRGSAMGADCVGLLFSPHSAGLRDGSRILRYRRSRQHRRRERKSPNSTRR